MTAPAQSLSSLLLAWYGLNARRLPWRTPPGGSLPDPYRVWLSEVMLQQTTVAAVIPYFERFTSRWPTVQALAMADDAEVMGAWAGLGYYARARNLIACARAVAACGGAFPSDEAGLRQLPGLGAYTAAAVAAFAFGEASTVVDANVERVVARLFAIGEPLPAARREIHRQAQALTPQTNAGDFAQAMMDLGATICTARTPRCLLCPLAAHCAGYREGRAELYPVKPARAAKPERRGTAWWIEHSGTVWLVRRPAKGMLGGMRALPSDDWHARADGAAAPPLAGPWRDGGVVQHTFTHFSLELSLQLYSGDDWASLLGMEGEWHPCADIDSAGLPTLFAKAARLARAETGE